MWTIIMDGFVSEEISEHYPFVTNSSRKRTKTFFAEATSLLDSSTIRKSEPIKKRATANTRSPETFELFCETCGKSFSSKKSYLSHVYQTHPDNSTLDKYPCPLCSKKFHYQFLLNKHVTISHSKKSFICQECNNSYQSLKALRLHQRKKHL